MLYSHHTELEEGREKAMSDKNRKPVIPQVITVAFMVVLPLTVDKINHNGVLLGYHPDTGGGGRMHLLDTNARNGYWLL